MRAILILAAVPLPHCAENGGCPNAEDAEAADASRNDRLDGEGPVDSGTGAVDSQCDMRAAWHLDFDPDPVSAPTGFPARLDISGDPGAETSTFMDGRPRDCTDCGPVSVVSVDRDACEITISGDASFGDFQNRECLAHEHSEMVIRFAGRDTRTGVGTLRIDEETVCGARDVGSTTWIVTATRLVTDLTGN